MVATGCHGFMVRGGAMGSHGSPWEPMGGYKCMVLGGFECMVRMETMVGFGRMVANPLVRIGRMRDNTHAVAVTASRKVYR